MAALRTEEFQVNMGPHHPSTHGVCRLLLTLDGEKIVEVEPYIGYLHRSIEKICENRTYPMCIPILDRFEYVTAMSSNYVFSLAAERLAEIEVPERAAPQKRPIRCRGRSCFPGSRARSHDPRRRISRAVAAGRC